MESPQSTESAQRAEAPPGRMFMPIKEAAAALDVSEMTIRRAYAAGEIPGITIGRSCRVLVAFIVALIALAETGQQVAVEEFGRQWKADRGGEAPALARVAS
jgi:excisionase family DNA binding protein